MSYYRKQYGRRIFMKRITGIFIVLSLVLMSCNAPGVAKVYVSTSDVDLTKLLAPPPAQDSAQTKAEIKEILIFQESRTKQMADFAAADQNITVYRFADVLGDKFKKENLPLTTAFFDEVVENAKKIVDPAKNYWKRPRPYEADKRVNPCVNKPGNASYPSGHSTIGNLIAIILANMVPEKKEELFNRGLTFALNRVIGGVHYRTDIEAGRIAAALIAEDMFNNEEFKEDFESAKAELRKVLGY